MATFNKTQLLPQAARKVEFPDQRSSVMVMGAITILTREVELTPGPKVIRCVLTSLQLQGFIWFHGPLPPRNTSVTDPRNDFEIRSASSSHTMCEDPRMSSQRSNLRSIPSQACLLYGRDLIFNQQFFNVLKSASSSAMFIKHTCHVMSYHITLYQTRSYHIISQWAFG